MRSRTIREGSVGLLILVGLGIFIGLVLWIRGISLGKRNYTFVAQFANAAGMEVGAAVRYRGVKVGRITKIEAGTNGVAVTVEISPPDLKIPKDAVIEANQAGLIGETSIDIKPLNPLPAEDKIADPLDNQCNNDLIICNKALVNGQIGVSFDDLLRGTVRIAEVYTDPKFVTNINAVANNAATAAAGVTKLTNELSTLSTSFKGQLRSFSGATDSITRSVNLASLQVGLAANQISGTANQFNPTATQLNQLVTNANGLLNENGSSLVATLNDIQQTSQQLRTSVSSLSPVIDRVSSGKLLENLETLSANAAQASANLRTASANLNNPFTALIIQQTLDSARATFANTQKITADLDELTGDPNFRSNLRDLVNGLSSLVSSTQQLQQQVQVAQLNTVRPSPTPTPDIKQTAPIPLKKPNNAITSRTVSSQHQPVVTPPTSKSQDSRPLWSSEQ